MNDNQMTKGERDQLIRVVRLRAKQAEREAEMREKVLLAEVRDQMTAQFQANDELFAEAVAIARDAAERANAQIQARCAELGIPAQHAPGLQLGWRSRSPEYQDNTRRAELFKLAGARLQALTKAAKTQVQSQALDAEEKLILGGLESLEAKAMFAAMPTVEQIMPALSLEDLGVVRWQPPEDAATQLTAPMTPADKRRRRVLRAIEANPQLSDRKVAELVGCDHKTVGTYRRERGEIPAITGGFPDVTGEFPTEEIDGEVTE
jgi:hypothetical protein